jgi:hypothetical protein
MPEPDAFDPTHALDGWRPPAPAPVQELDLGVLLHPEPDPARPLLVHAGAGGFDPTHLLDGWRPPAPAPLDLELKSLLRGGSVTDEAKMARLKARGYEMLDVEDVELVEAPSMPRVLVEASVLEVPPIPPLAEADLVPPPLNEDAAQVAGAVDLPLPDEEVWPLFMEEAQILEAGLEADEVAPAFESAGLELLASEPEVEPVPSGQLEPAPSAPPEAREAPTTAERPDIEPEAEPLPSVEFAVVEAPAVEVVAAEHELMAADEDQVVENAVAPETEVASTAIVEMPSEPEPALALDPTPEALATAELAEAEAVDESVPSVQAELPPALAAEAPTMEAPVTEPEPEPLPFDEEAGPPVEVAATEAPAPLAVDDQRVPEGDFAAEPGVAEPSIEPPPASQPVPSFIDEIQLPSVPPPPAEFEAPVLDFRAAPPPPEPDPKSVLAGIELPEVAPLPMAVETPEIDIAALAPQRPQADPRLLAHWQAGAWTALARQITGASEELMQTSKGLRVHSRAPQWLCAVWPPQRADGALGRWPEMAAVVAAETTAEALQQLLIELPDEAPLWSADLEADWDLGAELVLHQDAALRPAQARALRELAEAERSARLTRFSEGYALHGSVARRRA